MSSTTKAIPVSLKDPRNDINFSTSIGGTIYGTTPGGTKIVYDRNTLLQYRNSPLSKTPPPPQLAHIIDTEKNKNINEVKQQQQPQQPQQPQQQKSTQPTTAPKQTNDDEMFQME